ncbi:hypothetical protein JN085_26805 [Mycolicibacterium austroafricanum]|nr:hypothetical protein JN085_26805 [Mycolicibacterium austroafricanum]
MSWLLVALIPGLLMLATFGLERVESGLGRDTVTPSDVDEFLEQARAGGAPTPARDGSDRAPQAVDRRPGERDAPHASLVTTITAQGLPTREYLHQLSNTEFRQTRHADRV